MTLYNQSLSKIFQNTTAIPQRLAWNAAFLTRYFRKPPGASSSGGQMSLLDTKTAALVGTGGLVAAVASYLAAGRVSKVWSMPYYGAMIYWRNLVQINIKPS